jgi:hypothetical protein
VASLRFLSKVIDVTGRDFARSHPPDRQPFVLACIFGHVIDVTDVTGTFAFGAKSFGSR